MADFAKTHYVAGEYVRIDINSDVRYWGEVLTATPLLRPDGVDVSEYKVSLSSEPHGMVIGEASFVGSPPFFRLRSVPSRTLIKKFIRSCATRSLFPGSPWIVAAEVARQHGLPTELPPHLAAAALQAAAAPPDSRPEAPPPPREPEGPLPDEKLQHAHDLQPAPTPCPFDCVDSVADIWVFCQSFAAPLRLAPFPLRDLVAALGHDALPSPLLEAVHTALLAPLAREHRTGGEPALAAILLRSAEAPDQADSDTGPDEDDEAPAVLDALAKTRWWDASPAAAAAAWWVALGAFLATLTQATSLPRAHWLPALLHRLEPGFCRPAAKGYLALGYADRVAILQLLVRLVETLPLVRQHVDAQQERAIEARKTRRQLDIDRNKLAKELADLERELEPAAPAPDEPPSRDAKRLEAAIRKTQAQEAAMEKRSETLLREERKASGFRVQALGTDRAHRRFWWLDYHLLGASVDQQGSNMVLVEDPAAGHWAYYDDPEQLAALMAALDPRGIREARLHASLARALEPLTASLRRQAVLLPPASASKADAEDLDGDEDDEEEEEMVVVPRRRGRKPKAKARPTAAADPELPPFLRYRNTLALKK